LIRGAGLITYKFRLYPTKLQQTTLWTHANALNKLYNYFLDQRIRAYEAGLPPVYRKHQQAELVQLKKDNPKLKEINAQVLQQVPLRLDKSYKVFFTKMKSGQGKPNFRSCQNFFGITYPQGGYKLEANYFVTKIYGKIRLRQHRCVVGQIKQVTLTTINNEWFLCITTDHIKSSVSGQSMVGIDLGVTNLIATSDGQIIKNKNHAKYFDKQINKLKSKRDTKCKKYSRRYKFLSKVINRLYGVKKRKINDFLHKVSYGLTQKYDTIVIEDLNLKKMSESKITGLNREIRNVCLARFVEFLSYKANKLIKVNPAYTSKMCNSCGKMHDMPLSNRTMKCECGNVADRDINAAKNILCLGQAYLLNTGSTAVSLQEILTTSQNSSLEGYANCYVLGR
jgi:putative transposase